MAPFKPDRSTKYGNRLSSTSACSDLYLHSHTHATHSPLPPAHASCLSTGTLSALCLSCQTKLNSKSRLGQAHNACLKRGTQILAHAPKNTFSSLFRPYTPTALAPHFGYIYILCFSFFLSFFCSGFWEWCVIILMKICDWRMTCVH